MKNRKQQLTDALHSTDVKKGFGYFLKLSGNPNMKRIKGELTPLWKNFLTKNRSNEK